MGVVDLRCPLGGHHCRATSRYRAASRLARISCHGKAPVLSVSEAGQLLEALGRHQHRDLLRGCLADLLAVMCASQKTAQALAAAGGIIAMVNSAAAMPSDRPVQLYVLRAVSVLAACHSSSAKVGSLSSSDAAAAAGMAHAAGQRFADATVQKAVCEALASLVACGESAAAAALHAGARQATEFAMGLGNLEAAGSRVLESALRTSRALSKACGGMHGEGVGELVAALRRNMHDASILAEACNALRERIKHNPFATECAAAEGCFQAALAAAAAHPQHLRLQVFACGLMADIIDASESGVAEIVGGPLAASDAAGLALKACLTHSSSLHDSSRKVKAGGADGLIKSFARISKALPVESIIGVLDSHKAATSPDGWVMALKLTCDNMQVQQLLIEAANNLVREGLGLALIQAGAVEGIIQAMLHWPSEPGFQRASCEALAAFAWCDGQHAVASGAFEACMRALRRHQAFPWVCTPALEALAAQLLKCNPANFARLAAGMAWEEDCWDLATGALLRHPTNRRVLTAANQVLQLLSGSTEEDTVVRKRSPPGSQQC
eukprot:TRINITY_DN23136_c0_g1_i1.p1 TRINITY_DN23136_c0_g1~~TRINITY_DN23136_c0_g1_i1.p1  ORF type:complete len:554 (+),score=121.43 TRINITY_DN23136_c0_g1_i1:138-1799(+)